MQQIDRVAHLDHPIAVSRDGMVPQQHTSRCKGLCWIKIPVIGLAAQSACWQVMRMPMLGDVGPAADPDFVVVCNVL